MKTPIEMFPSCRECTDAIPCLKHVVAYSDAWLDTPAARAAEYDSIPGEIDMSGPEPEPPCFVAMIPNYWGKGSTIDKAKANARKAGAREPINGRGWLVKLMPPGACNVYVNEIGAICWSWTESTPNCDRAATPETIAQPRRNRG